MGRIKRARLERDPSPNRRRFWKSGARHGWSFTSTFPSLWARRLRQASSIPSNKPLGAIVAKICGDPWAWGAQLHENVVPWCRIAHKWTWQSAKKPVSENVTSQDLSTGSYLCALIPTQALRSEL
jgi:hypothetical protein